MPGRKRSILAELHRPVGDRTEVVWRRHYTRVSRAIPRAVELCLLDGQPSDRIEFSHSEFGFQIAVVTLHVGGSISLVPHKDLGGAYAAL